MRLSIWGHAALALVLCATVASAAQSKPSSNKTKAKSEKSAIVSSSFEDELSQAELASYDECQPCSSGCMDCSGPAGFKGLMSRPIQIVAGAQYIYARPTINNGIATVTQNITTSTTSFNCYDFDYNSSYGFYGGLQLCDCGGAIIFNYNRMTSSAGGTADADSTNQVFGGYEVDGDINFRADVDVRNYDVTFQKTIPLGCPLECCDKCGCGDQCGDTCCDDSCCDSCGGGWCPAWDIVWLGGFRFVDANWNRGALSLTDGDNFNTSMNFNGFGGHVGLLGRRYIGKRGLFSLYAKGDWSLILGQQDITTTISESDNLAFITKSCDAIIPITEIELGGSAHIRSNITASAGYFWAAYHDLGMSDVYTGFGEITEVSHYDTANILGFDGLFARIQVAF